MRITSNDNLHRDDPEQFPLFVIDMQKEMGWNDAVLGTMLMGIMVHCFRRCGFSKGQVIAYVARCYDGELKL